MKIISFITEFGAVDWLEIVASRASGEADFLPLRGK
jgi:hypothetical protein